MNYIDEVLVELSSRLPELEWKITALHSSFSSHSLPPGLFRPQPEFSASACVEEIKVDIKALSNQENQRSAAYLASKINQKINVLVALCQIHGRKNKPEGKIYFGLDMLSTRQQWIQTLESNLNTLELQQEALSKSLEHIKLTANGPAILNVQGELGEVLRRVTLAKEELLRATS